MKPERLSIPAVNALDRGEFVARFGAVYEHSPWVARDAWPSRPFADRDALAEAMRQAVLRAGREHQLELLRAHPKLGARLALTALSRAEQSGAGLGSATAEERAELLALNEAYERRFGFPFILAVKNATVAEILASCRSRSGAPPQAEFDEALRQVFRIAGFRLADLC
ncbi:MAG: 2-oxo-4-hydroxy-4-carboxy-5-ureidoimidazoline decarboxylase [Gammaproteobacteria bacterium]